MSTYVISGPGKDNRQDYKTNPMQLNGFDDLPKFLQFALKYSGTRYKKLAFVLTFLVQLGGIPVWIQITNSLAVGIILCFFFTIGNYVTMMLTPDMSKGVFLDIFLQDKKKTKEISDGARSMMLQSIPMLLIILPCFFVFFQLPFANTSRLGDHTFIITITAAIIGDLVWVPSMIVMASVQLLPQVSLLHEAKIKSYLLNVQNVILDKTSDEENGLSTIDQLADEQEQAEKWIGEINKEIHTFNSFQVGYYVLALLLFLIFAASGYGLAVTLVFSFFSAFEVLYVCQILYALAKPSRVWNRQKISLLNNAKVILNLKFPRESFKEWLSLHDLNAAKIFGTKVTFEKMKQASGLLTSAIGIVLYFLLREELRGITSV